MSVNETQNEEREYRIRIYRRHKRKKMRQTVSVYALHKKDLSLSVRTHTLTHTHASHGIEPMKFSDTRRCSMQCWQDMRLFMTKADGFHVGSLRI